MKSAAQSQVTKSKQSGHKLISQEKVKPLENIKTLKVRKAKSPNRDNNSYVCLSGKMPSVVTRRKQKLKRQSKKNRSPAKIGNDKCR